MTLSTAQGKTLLALARAAIAAVFDANVDMPPDTRGALEDRRGVFVTLRSAGQLRGCVGRVESDTTLYATTATMARAAAFEDPRFAPLTTEELGEITIEVSVLTALERVGGPEDVIVGVHGVVVGAGSRRALLLPQVPVERGWNRDTFLTNACVKAGLAADAWQDACTSFHIFSAQVFVE